MRRSLPDRRIPRRAVAVTAIALLLAFVVAGSAEAADLRVIATTIDAQAHAAVVVQTPTPSGGVRAPATYSVLRHGRTLPPGDLTAYPDLSVGIVVDPATSSTVEHQDDLQPELSGAAQLVMQLPHNSNSTLVSATNNGPQVLAHLSADPSSVVAGLGQVRTTSIAPLADMLWLAASELSGAPDGPHVIILFTSRAVPKYQYLDDETSLLAGAGTILDVVQSGALDPVWQHAASRTGGEANSSDGPAGASAYDRVVRSLSGLYQLRFEVPRPRSEPIDLRVSVDGATMSTTTSLSAGAGEQAPSMTLGLAPRDLVVLVLVVGLAVGIAYRRWSRRKSDTPHPLPS